MDLYIRDRNLEIIGIIDNAKSVIWNPKYYEDGAYEIYIEATEQNLELFRNGYFITRYDDEYVGLIERDVIEENIETGDYITVSGKFADSLLSYRIVRYLTYSSDYLITGIEKLINENAVNPTYYPETRKINCLEMGQHSLASNPTTTFQVSYDNLLEYIRGLLKTVESSIKVNFNSTTNKLSIIMYTGVDRSKNQNVNDRIIFSTEYKNLFNSTYSFDIAKENNAIYVGGEGEGTDRIVDKFEVPLDDGVVSDIDRKEAFLDAASIKSSWEDEDGTEHQLTTPQYRELLQEAGKQAVVLPEETLEGEIDISFYKYREEYKLGDKITLESSLVGVSKDVRIIEIQEVEDENGYRIIPIYE